MKNSPSGSRHTLAGFAGEKRKEAVTLLGTASLKLD
jgi:hypothetical protein